MMQAASFPTMQLIYPPIYNQYKHAEDIFQKYVQPAESLSRKDLKQTLIDRKIEKIDFDIRLEGLFVLCFSLVVLGLFPALTANSPHGDPVVRNASNCLYDWRSFIDTRTNETADFQAPILGPCDSDFEHPRSLLTLYPYSAVCLLSLGYLFKFYVSEEIKRRAHNRNAECENQKIDLILNQLSSHNPLESDEAAPQEIALAFPYLSENQLPLLAFSHLKAARKMHWELFQARLSAANYATRQLEIWYLCQHIASASRLLQRKIITNEINQEIIGSNPQFFQMVVRQLKPLSDKMAAICGRILKQKIFKREVLLQRPALDCTIMAKCVAEGKSLRSVVREALKGLTVSSASESSGEEHPYRKFMQCGKLQIHHLDECYTYFMMSLKEQNREVADWFESHLSQHMEYFANHPQISSIMEDISKYNLNRLKLHIDKFLTTTRSLPAFNSREFASTFLFATQNALNSYAQALQTHYAAQLLACEIAGSPEYIAHATLEHAKQIELLFPKQQELYLELLKTKITTILTEDPAMIDALATQGRWIENQWLLECLQEVYLSNPVLYAGYWLSPLETVYVQK